MVKYKIESPIVKSFHSNSEKRVNLNNFFGFICKKVTPLSTTHKREENDKFLRKRNLNEEFIYSDRIDRYNKLKGSVSFHDSKIGNYKPNHEFVNKFKKVFFNF